MRRAPQIAGLNLLGLALLGCGGPVGEVSATDRDQAATALSATPSGDPGVVVGTLSAADVPAPDGSLSLGDLMLSANANLVLLTATGSMSLGDGAVRANSYVVDPIPNDDLVANSATFEQIDAVFSGNEAVACAGPSQLIPAAALVPGGSQGLVIGATVLPVTVDIIAAHVEHGVRSYKVFEVTFAGPQ